MDKLIADIAQALSISSGDVFVYLNHGVDDPHYTAEEKEMAVRVSETWKILQEREAEANWERSQRDWR